MGRGVVVGEIHRRREAASDILGSTRHRLNVWRFTEAAAYLRLTAHRRDDRLLRCQAFGFPRFMAGDIAILPERRLAGILAVEVMRPAQLPRSG